MKPLSVKGNSVTYFETFVTEHIPEKIKKFNGNKNVLTNIFRTQAYDLIICGYVCIKSIDFIFKGESLTDFKNLF